jgi:hypothetical protein
MKIQAEADEIIAAYMACGETIKTLEQEHGYVVNVHKRGDQYVWLFVDKTTVVLNSDGSMP